MGVSREVYLGNEDSPWMRVALSHLLESQTLLKMLNKRLHGMDTTYQFLYIPPAIARVAPFHQKGSTTAVTSILNCEPEKILRPYVTFVVQQQTVKRTVTDRAQQSTFRSAYPTQGEYFYLLH